MDRQNIARGLLAFLCAFQGIATLAIDLNRSHATNPKWPGHARFHLVWQTMSAALLAALEVALLCWPGPYSGPRFYLATVLTCIPLLAFLAAFVGRTLFGGTLSDANGIPPARLRLSGRVFPVDLNLAAVTAALLVLAVLVCMYSWRG